VCVGARGAWEKRGSEREGGPVPDGWKLEPQCNARARVDKMGVQVVRG
jgi:hypothetical protein